MSAVDQFYLLPAKTIDGKNDSAELQNIKQDRKAVRIARKEEARVKAALEQHAYMKKMLDLHKDAYAMRAAEVDMAIYSHIKAAVQSGRIPEEELRSAFKDDLAPVLADMKSLGQPAYDINIRDDEVLHKVSTAMGGLPSDLRPKIQDLRSKAMTLHEAAKLGDCEAIERFVSELHFPVDYEDSRGLSPIAYAISKGHLNAAKLLAEKGASLCSVDAEGNSGLHFAAGYGQTELVEYLLEKRARLQQKNAAKETALALAVANKHTSVASLLQSKGATQ